MGKVTTLFEDSAKTVELYPRTKTSAVSDSDGNTLGDVAVWNALNVVSGVNAVKVGVDMDLLWENENPTSSFTSQSVSLDLSEYNLIYIYFYPVNTETYRASSIIRVGEINQLLSVGSSYMRRRTVDATDISKITFGGGTYLGTISTWSSSDASCVPNQIYGIRGQINDLTGD